MLRWTPSENVKARMSATSGCSQESKEQFQGENTKHKEQFHEENTKHKEQFHKENVRFGKL